MQGRNPERTASSSAPAEFSFSLCLDFLKRSPKEILHQLKDEYVISKLVETQKTRGGIDIITKENTRPYRFNEFDNLAVSMQPSTEKWISFMYTVANWLLPQEGDPKKMFKFQPVSPIANNDWTDNFETCVSWMNQNLNKKIKS